LSNNPAVVPFASVLKGHGFQPCRNKHPYFHCGFKPLGCESSNCATTDNLKAACALHFAYYNFCRIHKSLRFDLVHFTEITMNQKPTPEIV
jgi:hypothetical protein